MIFEKTSHKAQTNVLKSIDKPISVWYNANIRISVRMFCCTRFMRMGGKSRKKYAGVIRDSNEDAKVG